MKTVYILPVDPVSSTISSGQSSVPALVRSRTKNLCEVARWRISPKLCGGCGLNLRNLFSDEASRATPSLFPLVDAGDDGG